MEVGSLSVCRPLAQNSSFLGFDTAGLDGGLQSAGADARRLLAQNLVSILRRARTAHPAEDPRKMLLCFEPARHGDV